MTALEGSATLPLIAADGVCPNAVPAAVQLTKPIVNAKNQSRFFMAPKCEKSPHSYEDSEVFKGEKVNRNKKLILFPARSHR